MKKMYRFFGIALLVISLIACHFYKRESFILKKIDLYANAEKNEQIGKDLMYYEYGKMIRDSLKITDTLYLRNISWEDFIASDTKEVTFRLNLQNEAIKKKKELVALFDHFVTNKLDEYRIKEKQIDTAVSMGYYYISLINKFAYDSIWKQASPLLEKHANKEQLINMLAKRNAQYKSPSDLKVSCRLVTNEIDNEAGDFYAIYYVADDRAKEKIILENINHIYKFLGYEYSFSK